MSLSVTDKEYIGSVSTFSDVFYETNNQTGYTLCNILLRIQFSLNILIVFSVLNDLHFKTTCNVRPHFIGPMGGLKIEGPLYQCASACS